MPFTKRLLCSHISLALSAGLMLSAIPQQSPAQVPQFSCRANAAGDGWTCDTIAAPGTPTLSAPAQPRPVAPSNPAAAPASSTNTNTRNPADAGTANSQAANRAAVAASTPSVNTAFISPDDSMDWLPREAMTAEQAALLAPNCCGAFVDPSAALKTAENDPSTAQTVFNSAAGLQQISPALVTIDGEIVVQQGYRRMQNNNQTTLDQKANTILMQGDVEFREPNMLLRGSSAYIDNAAGVSQIESAQYVIHNLGANGSADSIVYTSESGLVSIENGIFSRCEPNSPFWHIEADSIVLDQANGRGYAKAAKLKIKNVPVFYYPGTLQFPLGDERISGFLAPSTGSTRGGGFDFELPYYMNLAPNYDATLSPRLISDRGVLTSLETRYLASWSMNTLNMSYLGGDKLFDADTATLPGSDSPPIEDRWFLGYEHYGRLGRNFSTFVDYNAVSDEDYFYDLGSNGLNVTSRTHLNRQGRLNFNSDIVRANLNVQRVQIIDPLINSGGQSTPYDRLPQLNFESDTYLAGGFRVALEGQVTSFDRSLDEDLFSPERLDDGVLVTGERLNLEPQISWSVETPGWFVRADGKYKYFAYSLEDQAVNTLEDPDFGIGVYSLDSGLVFERPMNGGYSQTLEPRAFYLFSDFEDQDALPMFDTSELNFSFGQLFRDNRFSGGDRVGDADQLSIALTSRILDPRGREKMRFGIGQIEYFEDRLVTMKSPSQTFIPRYSTLASSSAIAGEFAFNFSENWKLNTDVQWNEDLQEVQEGSFQLRYQGDDNRLVNLAYRYRGLATDPNLPQIAGIDTRIKQTDISAVWPVSASWSLMGRWNYDHSNSRNLETFAGVEYSNCCATIRLIGREWVDEDELFLPNTEPNRGIFVQFTLNGLGNITGGGVSSLLRDGIWGFRESAYE